MKIVLIIPEDKQDFEPLVYPPLGLLYIAAQIEKEYSDVEIFDLREEKNYIKNIPEADIYGITATSSQSEDVKNIAGFLKARDEKCFIILGGTYASYSSNDAIKYFDCVVVGEGENVINRIIKNRTKCVVNANNEEQLNIDDISFPSRHLMQDNKIVSNKLWEGYQFGTSLDKATTIMTSRGCSWSCSFCGNLPQKVRYRKPENVVEEIKHIEKFYNCKKFRFLDDNFLMNKKRLKVLCELLEKENIEFRCSGRTDLITEEVCEMIKKAGCKEIGFGIESADERVLKKINKKLNVEKHKKGIKIAKESGLLTKAFFMVGLPGETKETIEKNKKFFEEVKPDKWICTLFTPYPGCAIWKNPLEFDVEIKNKNLKDFYQTYPANSNIDTKYFTRAENTKNHKDMIQFLKELYKTKEN